MEVKVTTRTSKTPIKRPARRVGRRFGLKTGRRIGGVIPYDDLPDRYKVQTGRDKRIKD